jgi:hypothetical protein
MPSPRPLTPLPPVASPLQATLEPCPTCQRCVLVRVWHPAHGKTLPPRWETLAPPQSPVTGAPHVCEQQEPRDA